MKKALIYGLSAALLLVSLTACNKPQADQQNTEPNPTQAATSTPVPEEPITTQEPATITEPPAQTPAAPEPLSNEVPATPDKTEDNQPPEESSPVEQAQEVQLFTDCNETVFATGTVNLRSGPGTSYDKVGSLTTGQSVTRTGKGIAGTEAEGWSRVVLSNDSEVYVSSNYISTTKPVQQQPTPSSSSTSSSSNQSTTSNQSSTSTPSTPSSQGTSSQTTSQPSTSSDGSGLTSGVQAAREEELRIRLEEYGGAGVGNRPLTPEEIAEIGSQLNRGN